VAQPPATCPVAARASVSADRGLVRGGRAFVGFILHNDSDRGIRQHISAYVSIRQHTSVSTSSVASQTMTLAEEKKGVQAI
jgi:hypothetical protein